jgi:hypothetical protein
MRDENITRNNETRTKYIAHVRRKTMGCGTTHDEIYKQYTKL